MEPPGLGWSESTGVEPPVAGPMWCHQSMLQLGSLEVISAVDRTDLLAAPTAAALGEWPERNQVGVAVIDPQLADTAAFCEAYSVPLAASANCVVLTGKREGQTRMAACVVLATTRADVNNAVRRWLDVRKISFAPMDEAVALTGMEYGGITPIGLPGDWPVLVDSRVMDVPAAVIGSGIRASKIVLPGSLLSVLPNAHVVEDLASP